MGRKGSDTAETDGHAREAGGPEAREIVVERDLDAPPDLVFRAWTEPARFARWFGPHGTAVRVRSLDARPGGTLHFRHDHADGNRVWVKGTYREVEEAKRLVLTVGFSDEEGGHAERPGFPSEMRITAVFEPRGEGTRVTVRHTGLVIDQGEGQGWTESLERLAQALAES